jgi:hypothetical protein
MKLLKGIILSTTLVFNSAWATPPAVEFKNILCNVGASAYSTGLAYAINGLSFDKGFEAIDGAAKRRLTPGAFADTLHQAVLQDYSNGYSAGSLLVPGSSVGKQAIKKYRDIYKASCLASAL